MKIGQKIKVTYKTGQKVKLNDPGIKDYESNERQAVLERVFVITDYDPESGFICIKEIDEPSEAEIRNSELQPLSDHDNSSAKAKKTGMKDYNFVDLGLPSGTLWADENAKINGREELFSKELRETWPKNYPTAQQFRELANNCKIEWDDNREGYLVTGPSSASIFFPVKQVQAANKKQLRELGYYCYTEINDVFYSRKFVFKNGSGETDYSYFPLNDTILLRLIQKP